MQLFEATVLSDLQEVQDTAIYVFLSKLQNGPNCLHSSETQSLLLPTAQS